MSLPVFNMIKTDYNKQIKQTRILYIMCQTCSERINLLFSLKNNGISLAGAKHLVAALKENTTIIELE